MMERNQAHKQTVNRKKVFHLQRQTMNERTFTDATLTNTNSDNEDEFPITQFSPLMLETHHKNLPIPTPYHPNIHQELLLRILTLVVLLVHVLQTVLMVEGMLAHHKKTKKKKLHVSPLARTIQKTSSGIFVYLKLN